MRIRKEYELKGIIIPDERILTDTEDEFSYWFYTKRGQVVVAGYNRSTFAFWRNKPHDQET